MTSLTDPRNEDSATPPPMTAVVEKPRALPLWLRPWPVVRRCMRTVPFLCAAFLSTSVPAQDLPPHILADQYLLEATKALEDGDAQEAIRAFTKIEMLDAEPPDDFSYYFGKLLVENGTASKDILKGQKLLKSFVVNISKDSVHYTATLELLTQANRNLKIAEKEEEEELMAELADRRRQDREARMRWIVQYIDQSRRGYDDHEYRVSYSGNNLIFEEISDQTHRDRYCGRDAPCIDHVRYKLDLRSVSKIHIFDHKNRNCNKLTIIGGIEISYLTRYSRQLGGKRKDRAFGFTSCGEDVRELTLKFSKVIGVNSKDLIVFH